MWFLQIDRVILEKGFRIEFVKVLNILAKVSPYLSKTSEINKSHISDSRRLHHIFLKEAVRSRSF